MILDAEQRRMVLALSIVAICAGMLLALTDRLTRAPIAEAQRQAMMRSLMQVLPPHANDPLRDTLEDDGVHYFIARDAKGEVLALAWETVAPDGYSGSIHILIGVTPKGETTGVRVTEHRETPGLGDGIARNQAWIDSFTGQSLDSRRWAVKKDGGDFDQFTGATISPRAVVRAVGKGLAHFMQRREKILQRITKRGAKHATR